ncbi:MULTISPECIES: enoyl-CoA hydratase-related protein [Mesorhizobium]|uniref:Enoyl-CoA hydratase n=1 Tax=Rhizobium loti TaxID=381 RepID=A0AA91FBP8_RHILI|nr:hypothetical protein ASE05_06295 [Mesorhizobium sp. Root172]OBQ71380.1 hypothetical protein A8145_00345 [Mesorhizobium loti]
MGIALAADIVIAARSAYFYEPFVGIALVADAGNPLFLSRTLGRVRASGMMLLGDRITAERSALSGRSQRTTVCMPPLWRFARGSRLSTRRRSRLISVRANSFNLSRICKARRPFPGYQGAHRGVFRSAERVGSGNGDRASSGCQKER